MKTPAAFRTPLSTLPGGESKYKWNPNGQGLIWKNYEMPLVVVTAGSDIAEITKFAKKNEEKGNADNGKALYHAKISSYMGKDKVIN